MGLYTADFASSNAFQELLFKNIDLSYTVYWKALTGLDGYDPGVSKASNF